MNIVCHEMFHVTTHAFVYANISGFCPKDVYVMFSYCPLPGRYAWSLRHDDYAVFSDVIITIIPSPTDCKKQPLSSAGFIKQTWQEPNTTFICGTVGQRTQAFWGSVYLGLGLGLGLVLGVGVGLAFSVHLGLGLGFGLGPILCQHFAGQMVHDLSLLCPFQFGHKSGMWIILLQKYFTLHATCSDIVTQPKACSSRHS